MVEACAIWGSRTIQGGKDGDRYKYLSPRAGGSYAITGTARQSVKALDDDTKARLTSWILDQNYAFEAFPLVTEDVLVTIKLAPIRTITERRDRLLRAVSDSTPKLGDEMQYVPGMLGVSSEPEGGGNPNWENYDALLAATASSSFKELDQLISFAKKQGLLTNSYGALALTFPGHAHLEALRSTQRASPQAFVAMWFDDEMSLAYSDGIAPAITDAGYKPMRIDRKEHNNKIDDEIIAEIRRSRFVVADFTCGLVEGGKVEIALPRGGVYYEAGFAQGLGIPVIWTCRHDHIGHVHFDTRQFNHITWETPDDLGTKLRRRIGAVLGEGPLVAHGL